MHIIDLNSQILDENSRIAEENKKLFQKYGLHVTNFMSAPGAGKTTVLEETIKQIGDKYKISVIEGDLQTTIDSDRIIKKVAIGPSSKEARNHARPLRFFACASPAFIIARVPQRIAYED